MNCPHSVFVVIMLCKTRTCLRLVVRGFASADVTGSIKLHEAVNSSQTLHIMNTAGVSLLYTPYVGEDVELTRCLDEFFMESVGENWFCQTPSSKEEML